MTELSPKTKKNKKKAKASDKPSVDKNQSSEVLERVMSSIEMAGASLDFFENSKVDSMESASEQVADSSVEVTADQAFAQPDISQVDSIDASSEVSDNELAVGEEFNDNTENLLASLREDEDMMTDPTDDDDEDDEQASFDELGENSELEFIDQTQAYSIIESLLFSSDRPLGLGTFKQVFKGTTFQTKHLKKALADLQSFYSEAARGVTLEEINGGWQLRTKVDNMDFLRRLAKVRPFKLSGPALETLSIIAYKQPIVKSEVDEIRGVESGHLIRALMEKHLVSFQGKSELPGKPMQYGTTRKFLEIFGLRNLRELPSLDEIDQLLPDGIGIEEEDEKLSDVTDQLSESYQGNYSEGEEELGKIESTLDGIDTSSEFFEEEKRRQKDKRDRDRARDLKEAIDVGELVDEKDQKWLIRYEQRLLDEKLLAEQKLASASEESSLEDGQSPSNSLAEALSEESMKDFSAQDNEESDDDSLDFLSDSDEETTEITEVTSEDPSEEV